MRLCATVRSLLDHYGNPTLTFRIGWAVMKGVPPVNPTITDFHYDVASSALGMKDLFTALVSIRASAFCASRR